MKKLLIEFKSKDSVVIKNMDFSRNFNKRLCDLGLYNGAEIEIVKNDKYGPLIIKILGSKIALGRGEAEKIYATKQ